ncbi:MAG: hypothetical protein KatS3mg118_0979 [Paracoccaceae bacterium]|nr:MAG: hypothetical protein KatS3mg118_0979 [Paracoccaceae bacterium]
MALKTYKPTTPGQRGLVLIDRSDLWKGRPVKRLTHGLSNKRRPQQYRADHRASPGRRVKRLYRIIDFKRRKFDMPATVERIEYDPNRTAFIALIRYQDGEQSYILAPQRLAVGDHGGLGRAGGREARQRDAASPACRSGRSSTMSS